MRPLSGGQPDSRNIFFLTPGGDRVSFYAQQARALNLIWALVSDNRLRRRPGDDSSLSESGVASLDVAVVGAGVAGAMVSCALAALGHKASVFDKAATPLWRQIATRHRIVHPMLNQWAAFDDPHLLSPLTDLPFLNWHFAFCDDAVQSMLDDFRSFEAHGLRFQGNTEITEFRTAGDGLRVELWDEKRSVGDFDLVVCCTGFLKEKGYSQRITADQGVRNAPPENVMFNEYWCGDDLEQKKAEGRFRNYVISGGGDGGLVDALRLAYDYQYGKLAFRVARAMNIYLPEQVQLLLTQEKRNVQSAAYEAVVKAILEEPHAEPVRDMLDAALSTRNRSSPRIYLADQRGYRAPCESKAAPIHKLLVSYAMQKGRVIYAGKMTLPPKKWDTLELNGDQLSRKNTLIILRHGADTRLLLDGEPAKELRERQKASNEFSWRKVYPQAGLQFKNLPPLHDRHAPEFWDQRSRLLQRGLRQVDEDAVAFIEGEEFHIDAPNCDELPGELYGVPVVRTHGARPIQIAAME